MIRPVCPRCGGELRAPNEPAADWQCGSHGAVMPLHLGGMDGLTQALDPRGVPCWALDPLPTGWTAGGLGYTLDALRVRATVLACTGPAPLGGGLADLLVIAEEPGVGLGAGYAGAGGFADPGPGIRGAPVARVEAAGHPTALWAVATPADRCAVIGEAMGVWLWLVLWPAEAGHLLAEQLVLSDLREVRVALPVGAPSPYLWHLYPGESE